MRARPTQVSDPPHRTARDALTAGRERDFFIGIDTQVVTSHADILGDPSIDCVVELIGGTTSAKDIGSLYRHAASLCR